MGVNNVNLAALIGSRICHDLISPIGAINNGRELLDMSGSMNGPELDLISDSVGNAGARIRFFRVAFGSASDQLLGRPEIVSILDDLGRGGRLKMQWGPLEPQKRCDVRLSFLALLCLETAMPYGGEAQVSCNDGQWTVSADTTRLNLDEELWQQLVEPDSTYQITAAHVQFALVPIVAEELGRPVQVSAGDGQISITF